MTKQRQQARSLPSHSLFKNSWIGYSGLILLRTVILMAVDSFVGSHIVAVFVVCLAFCVSHGRETLKHEAFSNSRPYSSSVKLRCVVCMYLTLCYYRLWTDLCACWAAVRIVAVLQKMSDWVVPMFALWFGRTFALSRNSFSFFSNLQKNIIHLFVPDLKQAF